MKMMMNGEDDIDRKMVVVEVVVVVVVVILMKTTTIRMRTHYFLDLILSISIFLARLRMSEPSKRYA